MRLDFDLRLLAGPSVLVAALFFTGCGGSGTPTYPVEGKVTFSDGRPLDGGTVELQPVVQQQPPVAARGRIQSDGTFQISTFEPNDGAIEGEHRVRVVGPLPPGPIDPYQSPEPVIHHKFESYDSSELTFTVTPDGPNQLNITVEPPR